MLMTSLIRLTFLKQPYWFKKDEIKDDLAETAYRLSITKKWLNNRIGHFEDYNISLSFSFIILDLL